ncbi:MAG: DNA alkylation repair protein [Flavobacteriaceae bacterium]|nr:DNA alkylation repair protein [Flavobacteriaceae bacterium]
MKINRIKTYNDDHNTSSKLNSIIDQIQKTLNENADEKIKIVSQRFFKEPVKCYGIKAATVHQISIDYFKLINTKPKKEVFDHCETLWQSGVLEESLIACNWSYFIRKKYEPDDFLIFERWISTYVNNWASCDTLCNHSVGTFIEMYPAYLNNLKNFATSENRWLRRAAAVSLIIPAKKGKFLTDILDIADILLLDKDDLVQKGYGWMLKAASKTHQQVIFDYVIQNKAAMPRTALRYAIEKMPAALKQLAMER